MLYIGMIGEPQIDIAVEKLSNDPSSFKKQFGPQPGLPINPSAAQSAGRNNLMALFFKVIINARRRDKITARMGVRQGLERCVEKNSHILDFGFLILDFEIQLNW